MISTASAQNAVSSTAPASSAPTAQPAFGIMNLLPFAIIFFIFYFLLIRPQKKKMEKEQSFLNQIKKGDEIYTRSGILGTIVGLTDKIVTLDVGSGIQFKVLRSQVAGESKSIFNPQTVEKK
ncbi:MAG: preprotein translocase subunit YajC [Bacteriovoracaceae bacterium]|nr:preprotein translocase subunit YajC [Bacteriovoracaceae bacterium]